MNYNKRIEQIEDSLIDYKKVINKNEFLTLSCQFIRLIEDISQVEEDSEYNPFSDMNIIHAIALLAPINHTTVFNEDEDNFYYMLIKNTCEGFAKAAIKQLVEIQEEQEA